MKKAPSPWKIIFSEKKSFQLICADKTYKTVCGHFLKINGSRDIWLSLIFWFWKTVLHYKIINKTQSIKNQENPTHRFGDNYLTNRLVKFLQGRIKPWWVGALRVCTGYHFFQWKSLVRAFQPLLNSRVVYLNRLYWQYSLRLIVLMSWLI